MIICHERGNKEHRSEFQTENEPIYASDNQSHVQSVEPTRTPGELRHFTGFQYDKRPAYSSRFFIPALSKRHIGDKYMHTLLNRPQGTFQNQSLHFKNLHMCHRLR